MGIFRGYGSGETAAQPEGQTAESTPFDNTVSGLVAENVQDAIDEVSGNLAATPISPASTWLTGSGDCFTNNVENTPATNNTYNTTHAHYFPVVCPREAGTCTSVMVRLGSTPFSANMKLAIYRADGAGGRPGTLVVANNSFGLTASGSTTEEVIGTNFDYAANEVLWVGFKIDSLYSLRLCTAFHVIAQNINSNTVTGEFGISVSEPYATNLATNPTFSSFVWTSSIMSGLPLIYFVIG